VAEGFPMLAAFGAFQSWDGVFSFTYSHSLDLEPRRIPNFFDIKSHAPKLVHMPACAAMFLRGDVARARRTVLAPLPPEAEREALRERLNPWILDAAHRGFDSRLSLVHGLALDLREQAGTTPEPPSPPKNQKVFVSDTGELRWDISREEAGYYAVNEKRTKLFTGFPAGRTFTLGKVVLKIGPTRLEWTTISMTCRDGEGFDRPGRILIAATGLVRNTGAKLETIHENRVTLGRNWGEAPILCEGIPAKILLPVEADRVRFYPLDDAGNRREAVAVEAKEGKTVLALSPEHETLWYEVEIR